MKRHVNLVSRNSGESDNLDNQETNRASELNNEFQGKTQCLAQQMMSVKEESYPKDKEKAWHRETKTAVPETWSYLLSSQQSKNIRGRSWSPGY